jgi:3-hydroxyacyl-CoA dehydrogenase/3a,7a,12a-trihydroxy-5b-cholest-24-enoyl-CoA hydratase
VIAPCANTDMNRKLISEELRQFMTVDKVSPVAAYLCHEDCTDTGQIVNVGAGWIAKARLEYSEHCFDVSEDFNINDVKRIWPSISNFDSRTTYPNDITHAIKAMIKNIRRKSGALT